MQTGSKVSDIRRWISWVRYRPYRVGSPREVEVGANKHLKKTTTTTTT